MSAVILALAPTLAVLVGWVLSWHSGRKTRAKVEQVHEIVNSQRDAMMAEIAALKARLPANAETGV